MIIYDEIIQGTQEWKQVRKGKLTATSALTLATQGKGLETLCMEKAIERVYGLQESDFEPTEAMKHGIETESEARIIYELETNNEVKQIGFCEDNSFVGVSPDGLIGDDGLIEIKCYGNKHYAEYLINNEIDKKYYYQVQMQLLVTKRNWCDFVVYNTNFEKYIIIKKIFRNEETIKKITDGIEKAIKLINIYMEKLK